MEENHQSHSNANKVKMYTRIKKTGNEIAYNNNVPYRKFKVKQQLYVPHYMTPIKKANKPSINQRQITIQTKQHPISNNTNINININTNPASIHSRSITPNRITHDAIYSQKISSNKLITRKRSLTPIQKAPIKENLIKANPSFISNKVYSESTQGSSKELQIILSLKKKIIEQNELINIKDKELEIIKKDKNTSKFNELQMENNVYRNEIEKIKEMINSKSNETLLKKFSLTNQQLEKEKNELNEKIKLSSQKFEKEAIKNKNLRESIANIKNENDKTISILQEEITKSKNIIQQLNEKIERLEENENIVQSITEEKDKLTMQVSELNSNALLNQEEIKRINSENVELNEKVAKLEDLVKQFNSELTATKQEILVNSNLIQEKDAQITQITLQKEELTQSNFNYQKNTPIVNYFKKAKLFTIQKQKEIELLLTIQFHKLKLNIKDIEKCFEISEIDITQISLNICTLLKITNTYLIEKYIIFITQQKTHFNLDEIKINFIKIFEEEYFEKYESINMLICENAQCIIDKCEEFDINKSGIIQLKLFKTIILSLFPRNPAIFTDENINEIIKLMKDQPNSQNINILSIYDLYYYNINRIKKQKEENKEEKIKKIKRTKNLITKEEINCDSIRGKKVNIEINKEEEGPHFIYDEKKDDLLSENEQEQNDEEKLKENIKIIDNRINENQLIEIEKGSYSIKNQHTFSLEEHQNIKIEDLNESTERKNISMIQLVEKLSEYLTSTGQSISDFFNSYSEEDKKELFGINYLLLEKFEDKLISIEVLDKDTTPCIEFDYLDQDKQYLNIDKFSALFPENPPKEVIDKIKDNENIKELTKNFVNELFSDITKVKKGFGNENKEN